MSVAISLIFLTIHTFPLANRTNLKCRPNLLVSQYPLLSMSFPLNVFPEAEVFKSRYLYQDDA